MTIAAMLDSPLGDLDSGALKLHRGAASGEVSGARRLFQPLSGNGPGPAALEYLIIGGPPDLAPPSRRGGARNRADRQSRALTVAQVGKLLAAAAHAALLGLPFTRMVTIHWQAAGVPLEAMARATGRFIDLLSKALVRHGCRTAWLWVHEGGAAKGGHCHLLAHIPAALVAVVARLQKGWLRSITGRPYRRGVILSRPIGGRLGLEVSNPALHAANVEAAVGYVLKGAEPRAAVRFGLQRLEPGGLVIGKRCGASENINTTAQRKYRGSNGQA